MLGEKFLAVLQDEGPAAFATLGEDGPHLVATWNSYIAVLDEQTLAFPAGTYRKTEKNLAANRRVQMLVGSRKVPGRKSLGTGFRLTGWATFTSEGEVFAQMKRRFPWCRAAVILRVESAVQLL